jgi:hypothetical protein
MSAKLLESERQKHAREFATDATFLQKKGYKSRRIINNVFWAVDPQDGQRCVIKPLEDQDEVMAHRRLAYARHFSAVRGPYAPLGIATKFHTYRNRTYAQSPNFGLNMAEHQARRSTTSTQFRGWILQILEGLETLRIHHMSHGDVKPSNICVDGEKATLIDFADVHYDKVPLHSKDLEKARMYLAEVEDYPYVGPEIGQMLKKEKRIAVNDEKNDIYGLGVTILWFLTRRNIMTRSDIQPSLLSLERHCHKHPKHPKLFALVKEMIHDNPRVRPTLGAVKEKFMLLENLDVFFA